MGQQCTSINLINVHKAIRTSLISSLHRSTKNPTSRTWIVKRPNGRMAVLGQLFPTTTHYSSNF